MKTGEKIYTQHADHTEWLSKMKFYTDEIKILKNRLGEIADKNNRKDVLANVEHFQNQLIIQKNTIDEISHIINLEEYAIQKEIIKNPVAIDHREMKSNKEVKNNVDTFEKNFNELRADFKTFAAKWM
jgi:hypothetical protein